MKGDSNVSFLFFRVPSGVHVEKVWSSVELDGKDVVMSVYMRFYEELMK